MLKIRGRHNSSSMRKVLWCAEEIGIAYESIEVGGTADATDRAMHPSDQLPVIEDHGLPLSGADTIVRYLSARYALDRLYPADPLQRAHTEKWMDWTGDVFAPAWRELLGDVVQTAPAARDTVAIAAATAHCGRLLEIPDAALGTQPWLSGERFAMGDMPLGTLIHAWYGMPIPRPALPHLAAWYARLRQRPAYRKAVMAALG